MLSLGRRVGEVVVLETTEPLPAGTVIRVYLTDVGSNGRSSARLGFEAPATVKILRAELVEAKPAR